MGKKAWEVTSLAQITQASLELESRIRLAFFLVCMASCSKTAIGTAQNWKEPCSSCLGTSPAPPLRAWCLLPASKDKGYAASSPQTSPGIPAKALSRDLELSPGLALQSWEGMCSSSFPKEGEANCKLQSSLPRSQTQALS